MEPDGSEKLVPRVLRSSIPNFSRVQEANPPVVGSDQEAVSNADLRLTKGLLRIELRNVDSHGG